MADLGKRFPCVIPNLPMLKPVLGRLPFLTKHCLFNNSSTIHFMKLDVRMLCSHLKRYVFSVIAGSGAATLTGSYMCVCRAWPDELN